MSRRNIGLDYLRGLVTAQVVLHHAVLAYCRFGHFDPRHYLWSSAPIVDPARWIGFDLIVLFSDSYFMPLMFLLSGLFVRDSLRRKGPSVYLLDRVRRLGLPFLAAVLTIMPLAFYPSFSMTGSDAGFGVFWTHMVWQGPWPSGPAWFVAVLLGLDVAAVVVIRMGAIPRLPDSAWLWVALTAAAFMPMLILFGPSRWFAWGPLTEQASRALLYGAYFFMGVASDRVTGSLPLALALFVPLAGVQAVRLAAPALLPPTVWLLLYGVTVSLFCAAVTRGLLAAFNRMQRQFNLLDSLSVNAYGIYLLHYPFVVWGQYALLDAPIGAIPKAILVFAGSLGLSWCAAAAFRRLLSRSRPHPRIDVQPPDLIQ